MKLTNHRLTQERFMEILQTEALIRGRVEFYRHGSLEVNLEIYGAHTNDCDVIRLVTVNYEQTEQSKGTSNGARVGLDIINEAHSACSAESSLETIIREWTGRSRQLWDRDIPVLLTQMRETWRPAPWPTITPTHFHLMRHYTALRLGLASLLREAERHRAEAEDDYQATNLLYERFDGFLRNQLLEWNRHAQILADQPVPELFELV